MEENNNQNQDKQNLEELKKIEQFEMGGVEKPQSVEGSSHKQSPDLQINHYQNQPKEVQNIQSPEVDPTNGVPPVTPEVKKTDDQQTTSKKKKHKGCKNATCTFDNVFSYFLDNFSNIYPTGKSRKCHISTSSRLKRSFINK